MRFEQVAIVSVAQVDAPHRVPTAQIEDVLAATFARLGLPKNVLESLTGVKARRFWDAEMRPSDAATLAAEAALASAGVDRGRIGVLVNTSVCRDYVEPSTACFVHGNLKLPATCLNFDIANACLGFLDGMALVGNMIERGQVDYGLVVDAESSRHVVERTLERMRGPDCDLQMFKDQLATLTLGSGAAAMVLSHARLAPEGHAVVGSTSRAATVHNRLCLGEPDRGVTDTQGLLAHGVELASQTWAAARRELGWDTDSVDHFALHQVSQLHTARLAETIGFDLGKTYLMYPEHGNVGPAAVPMALAKAVAADRIAAGDRVVLGGIGSGLNCTAMGVLW